MSAPMTRENVFPDGHQGPMTRFSIADGAIHKDGRRVLTLTRIRGAAINNLNGRVRVREVRLRLDDDSGVSFGSYGASALGGRDSEFDAFADVFFDELALAAPDVPVDAEAALLPRFAFAVFVMAVGLIVGAIALSVGSWVVVAGALLVMGVGVRRAHRFRPWNRNRHVYPASEYISERA